MPISQRTARPASSRPASRPWPARRRASPAPRPARPEPLDEFDPAALAALSPAEFAGTVLARALRAAAVVVGAATSAIIAARIVPAAVEMMDALAIEAAEADDATPVEL